ncbi:hypothetical protein GALL_193500 [mine drainage metagenome]|uniref:Uncharacterized protein n=1 Tax=mine drainage metagenome TaxID=410659 RepID=A0A1J5S371_9ZZZZ
MSLYQATNIPVVFTQHSVDVANGNTSAITIYTSGTSTVDQIIQLTLNGSAANKYVCTGANEIAFDSSGNATVIIPAGQDSVTVTLVDGANQNTADQFSLTASIVDPSAPAGSTPVTSNTFDVTFDSPNPNASIISAGADRTITGDFKPLEKTSELSASAKIDPTWIVLSKTVGQTTTDAQGNTVVVTYVYKYNQVDDLGNVIPDTGQPDPNHNDMLPVCCPNRMCRRSMVCLGGEDDCRLLPFAVQFISQPSAFYYT